MDLATTHDHCGSCNNVCDWGRDCQQGECVCPNSQTQGFCEGLGCVDLASNSDHCGDCNAPCRSDQACSSGSCDCPVGETECDGACVDILADPDNCGECGKDCPAGQTCIEGMCGCPATGYGVCDGACISLKADEQNCGECNKACALGEQCEASACGCRSAVYCGQQCMPEGDRLNCGACGSACSAAQYCDGGSCECIGAGLSACGASCVDLRYDEQNCGACAKSCRSGELCSSGKCACPSGQSYCESAGKCVALASDPQNCGECGATCNPTESCSSGSCACPGYGKLYCVAEGKCADVLSNELHCGDCETACRPTEQCSYGACECPGVGEVFCVNAQACVNPLTNDDNCGTCGNACPAVAHCAAGGCVCDVAGRTLCGSQCFDLTSNSNNCGSCGKACKSPLICGQSQCVCPSISVGAAVQVTSSAFTSRGPVGAWDGTHVGVAYVRQTSNLRSSYSNVRFALLNPDGSVVSDVALTDYPPDDYEGVSFYNRPAIAWNGSEYGVAWVHHLPEITSMAGEVRFARVSAAGVPSPSVVVATSSELPQSANGPALAWSSTDNTYGVAYSSSSDSKLRLRLIGARGTSVTATGELSAQAYYPVLAADTSGRWGMAWFSDRTLSQVVFAASAQTADPIARYSDAAGWSNIAWDGTSFLTVHADDLYKDSVSWQRLGATSAAVLVDKATEANPGGALSAVISSSVSLLWQEDDEVTRLQRFTLPSTLDSPPTALDHETTIPTIAATYRDYALVQAGPSKLMFLYASQLPLSHPELYAHVLGIPACP